MNITDLDRLEADGVDVAIAGGNLCALLEDAADCVYVLIPAPLARALAAGDAIAPADGPGLTVVKPVARNARATIFRCVPVEEESNHGPSD